MEKIRTGVIGTGFIGPAHIEALRRLGFVDVVALADVDAQTAQAKADALCVPKAYGDWKDLIADPNVQVVHICTPNNMHFPMAKAAMEAGKDVVCEKPLAMTSEEAQELIRIARETGRVNAIGFNIRFYPLIHQVREMVEAGELGRIVAINGSYQQDWLQKETDYSWRLEPDKSGDSRAIADIGSHWMDAIEYMTGIRIERVYSDFATFFETRKKPLKPVETYSGKVLTPEDYADVPINTEDYATVLLHFAGGAHGSLTVNQVAAGRKNRMYFEIYGTKAAVSLDTERPNELWVGKRDGNNEIIMKDPSLVHCCARSIISFPGGHNEGFPDTQKQLFKSVYTYIMEGGVASGKKPEFPTFEDGYRELALCEAIVSSARKQQWEQPK